MGETKLLSVICLVVLRGLIYGRSYAWRSREGTMEREEEGGGGGLGAGGGGGGGGGGYPWELTIFSCGNLYALFF